MGHLKGVFIKKGLFFTVKGPRALPKLHTDAPPPLPPPPLFWETSYWDFQYPSPPSCGEGPGGGFAWNLGARKAPLT